MLQPIANLLSSERFMPHGMCFLWEPWLLWLHALSDGLIALSYYAIPLVIGYFAWRRRDLVFRHVFILSALFVLACGTTHVMAIWVIWNPDYGTEGLIKAATAAISLISLAAMWLVMPRALALPSPSQLRDANLALEDEIAERRRAEAEVRRLNRDLEERVRQRTDELEHANASLRSEVGERQRAEEALRAIIESSPLSIVSLDQDANVTLWNPAAEATFGYEASAVVGKPDPVVPDDEQAEFEVLFQRTLDGESLRDVDAIRRRRDGALINIRFSSAPLRDQDGGVHGATYIVEDVTEELDTQRQLVQAQKMEAIGQLTGGLAHDFNNLLTVVIGNLEAVQESLPQDAPATGLAEAALQAALRGGQLTRQLLAFARRQPLAPESIDLNKLVSGMTSLLRRTLGEQIEVSMRLADRLDPALADPAQVESAMANLAINARDAMADGGRLTIETGNTHLDADYAAENLEVTPGDYVMLALSDTGCGIPADVLPRVFEPFFTTKGAEKGTGMGLSMVYGFAKQSGGHIKIYSEPDHGTTVRLYLPRAARGAETAAPADAADHLGGSERILVVEDNPAVRDVAVLHLRMLGYEVLEASDGATALETLSGGESIDLLFTDIVMPGGMTGTELAREAQRRQPGLKVLFTSGFTEESLRQSSAGKVHIHLTKPYLKRDLARKVREILHNGAGNNGA